MKRIQIVARIAPDVRRVMTRAVKQKRAKNLNELIETALRQHLRQPAARRSPGPTETK